MADIFDRAKKYIDKEKSAEVEHKADMERMARMVGAEVGASLAPVLRENALQTNASLNNLASALSKVQINVKAPEVRIPEIKVPRPEVTVNVPEVKLPPMPKQEVQQIQLPERFKMEMDTVDNARPLPVMMMDTKGRPFQFPIGMGGGKTDFLTIKDIRGSTASLIDQIDGALKIVGSLSATLALDYGSGEIGSSTPRFVMATDAIASVNIVSGSASGTEYTEEETVGPGDGGLAMARNAAGSVYAHRVGSGTSETALRVVVATDSIASTEARLHALGSSGAWEQVRTDSGVAAGAVRVVHAVDAIASVNVVGASSSISSYLIDGDGAYRGTVPIPDLTVAKDEVLVHQVSGSNWSTSVTNTVTVTGSLTSTVVEGDIVADATDTGSAPVKVGGIARQANPTAVTAGDRVSATFDDLGRQVVRHHQVRDLITTAYISLTTGTETTLLAGASSTFHDMLYVLCANQSDAAAFIDFRCGTAGSVVLTVEVPASGTAGVSLPSPIPMPEAAQAWTADMNDITGTTIDISALFSKEV